MGRFIIKLTDPANNMNYYMLWSTIMEAPISYGMPKDEFEEFYRQEYGNEGMRELTERMRRVEATGSSAYPPYNSSEALIRTYDLNRPKVGNQKEFILNNYCRQRIG